MSSETPGLRPVWGEVDLDAVRANTRVLAELARPASLLAVVKADAYGHGAVPVARAALDAGATWLGVALVEEGAALRGAGIDAPILVLSEPAPAAAGAVVAHRLTPVVYTPAGIEALAKAVVDAGGDAPLPVHLKVDTGMHRAGCRVEDALGLVDAIGARPELILGGICTHFAVADEPDHPYTTDQVARFDALLDDLDHSGARPPLVHAANSAGLLASPSAHYDLVRVGIALYGVPPADALADRAELAPVLSLRARVAHVKELPAGSRVSYGLRYELGRAGRIATVPVGYADGVPRNLGLVGGEVLVRGRRFPVAGTVTMDQLMVDVGDTPVEVGDDVVLLGRQGDEEITAGEWARRLGTIAYEIVTGIGPRVPRRYVG
ncbi:MAG: alanine racemase [Acidimicrobiia bacterium]|jgi:alanine racemase|nr:alanine racemase [Acidimicrobiia bacterium]